MSLSNCGNCNNGSHATWGSSSRQITDDMLKAKEKEVMMLAACLQNMLVEVGVISENANPSYIELCAAADDYVVWNKSDTDSPTQDVINEVI